MADKWSFIRNMTYEEISHWPWEIEFATLMEGLSKLTTKPFGPEPVVRCSLKKGDELVSIFKLKINALPDIREGKILRDDSSSEESSGGDRTDVSTPEDMKAPRSCKKPTHVRAGMSLPDNASRASDSDEEHHESFRSSCKGQMCSSKMSGYENRKWRARLRPVDEGDMYPEGEMICSTKLLAREETQLHSSDSDNKTFSEEEMACSSKYLAPCGENGTVSPCSSNERGDEEKYAKAEPEAKRYSWQRSWPADGLATKASKFGVDYISKFMHNNIFDTVKPKSRSDIGLVFPQDEPEEESDQQGDKSDESDGVVKSEVQTVHYEGDDDMSDDSQDASEIGKAQAECAKPKDEGKPEPEGQTDEGELGESETLDSSDKVERLGDACKVEYDVVVSDIEDVDFTDDEDESHVSAVEVIKPHTVDEVPASNNTHVKSRVEQEFEDEGFVTESEDDCDMSYNDMLREAIQISLDAIQISIVDDDETSTVDGEALYGVEHALFDSPKQNIREAGPGSVRVSSLHSASELEVDIGSARRPPGLFKRFRRAARNLLRRIVVCGRKRAYVVE